MCAASRSTSCIGTTTSKPFCAVARFREAKPKHPHPSKERGCFLRPVLSAIRWNIDEASGSASPNASPYHLLGFYPATFHRETVLSANRTCQRIEAVLDTIRNIDAAIDCARSFPDSEGRFQMEELRHTEYRTIHANPHTAYCRFDETTLTAYRMLHQKQEIDAYSLVDLI